MSFFRTGETGDAADQLQGYLLRRIADFIGIDPSEIDPDRPLDEIGLDSLTSAELSLTIEDEIGVAVYLHELPGNESLIDLSRRMAHQLGDSAPDEAR